MKKIVLISVFLSTPVFASTGLFNDCYHGLELGHAFSTSKAFSATVDEDLYRHNNQTIGLYTGYKLNNFLAFEFGGNKSLHLKSNKKKGKSNIQGAYMAVNFHFPIIDGLELIPSVGMAYNYVHVKVPGEFDAKEDGFTPKFMLAVQYKVTDNIKVRGSVNQQRLNALHGETLKSQRTLGLGLGLNYSFSG